MHSCLNGLPPSFPDNDTGTSKADLSGKTAPQFKKVCKLGKNSTGYFHIPCNLIFMNGSNDWKWLKITGNGWKR